MSEAANLVDDLVEQYRSVRQQTEMLCRPLAVEDYGVQPMPDASPPKWHLAHTTWFFETFLLKPFAKGYAPFHADYEYLFNSYYNGVGRQFPRHLRGTLSRPTVLEVHRYRAHVDHAMVNLLTGEQDEVRDRAMLGLNHEQQHQELILTDLKYNLGSNPLHPAYRDDLLPRVQSDVPERSGAEAEDSWGTGAFIDHRGGLREFGAPVESRAFKFDNETPRHKAWLEPFRFAKRLVTNSEYQQFIADGGYENPALWLSEGWAIVQEMQWQAPLYWRKRDGEYWEYALSGFAPVEPDAPVVHVSLYEADAYARWAGARLPSEREWEAMADDAAEGIGRGNFVERDILHPVPLVEGAASGGPRQLFGDVWEWTASAYLPYPKFAPLPGTLGEYNGKFMSSQIVLRGGSCATPRSHIRPTYRNFFYAMDRWQFSGIRLADDVSA